ncbi:hypothetical protein ACS0TY_005123 [Phlomoides rotata]
MKNLTSLNLAFNYFSGEIPISLPQLRNLYALRLDRNQLTGSIPDSLGEFAPSFQYLYLSHNRLSGMVPKALSDLNFTSLELQRNGLNDDVSFLFGKNKTIQIADLSRSMLEFDLSNVEFPASLSTLDLNHNRITRGLLEGLTVVNFVNVSYNRLCGQIPVGGKLQELDYTSAILRRNEDDTWRWRHTSNEIFTTDSAYQNLGSRAVAETEDQQWQAAFHRLWKSYAPRRYQAIVWKLLHNRLPTKEKLQRMGIIPVSEDINVCYAARMTKQ